MNVSVNETAGDDPTSQMQALSHESLANMMLGVIIAVLVVMTVFVGLRIYVRARLVKKWGADDTMLTLSFVTVAFHGIMLCMGTRFGLGKHVWMTQVQTIIKAQKLAMFITMIYNIAFVTIKIAFLLQYRRSFSLPVVETLCNAGIGFLVLFGVSLLISAGVTYSLIFKGTVADSPVSVLGWWIANAAIHLLTNIFIFVLPLPLLGRLRLGRGQKLALAISFALGLLTCAVSVIRIACLPRFFAMVDMTYDGISIILWSVVELSCAVICCCIPTLRPLVERQQHSDDYDGGGMFGGGIFRQDMSFSDGPQRVRPDIGTGNDERISSSISCASETGMRKPGPSFSWLRTRKQSDHSSINALDEIEPVPPATPMITATAAVAMPVVEVNGVRRESEHGVIVVESGRVEGGERERGTPRRASVRSSLRSDSSLGVSLRRDLSIRRHMSIALTERDSDDDVYYFGVNEEAVDLECPTPLSPPPKCRKSTSS
ncbi:hypothetical protein CORC01_11278 [Colletotrichum orchidophilum]|uniref:Rhodopsin domain-containing protein n=1 Tax=Colletotrichum orchidophilum TaxID=1209926 RepID=A0A1G4AWE3_9PEZI|nr:uncharacterized protein CORC01_11278 [Colletotrichum orchidophilum]OHE93413.1 hypothetical protein CORC01_11278 [Colletotrichum orchidophilum]